MPKKWSLFFRSGALATEGCSGELTSWLSKLGEGRGRWGFGPVLTYQLLKFQTWKQLE